MKNILATIVAFLIAFGIQAQERISRLPVGDNAIKEQFASQVDRVYVSLWKKNGASVESVGYESVSGNNTWSGHKQTLKKIASKLAFGLNPNWEYAFVWKMFSPLQSGALFGSGQDGIFYFRGGEDEVKSSVQRILQQMEENVLSGYVPIWAPGVKAVRFIQRDISTGEIYLEEFSSNGAFNCPSLLERAGDGWLWLPVVILRPIQERDKRFYLFYSSDDLSDWDELDAGFGAKGDIVASSRGPVPPKMNISKISEFQTGSAGVIVRMAGLEPEKQYALFQSPSLPFGENRVEWSVQADRLGVISVTLSGQMGFVTLVTNPPSPSARRKVSPASIP
jgi:hypothetical protein